MRSAVNYARLVEDFSIELVVYARRRFRRRFPTPEKELFVAVLDLQQQVAQPARDRVTDLRPGFPSARIDAELVAGNLDQLIFSQTHRIAQRQSRPSLQLNERADALLVPVTDAVAAGDRLQDALVFLFRERINF